jgi:nucleotide-binding universal stress UspA family protein
MQVLSSFMLATDFRTASLDSTEVAVDLAAAFGARATLLHVFQPTGYTAAARDDERTLSHWEMQEIAQHLTRKDVTVEDAMVVEGHPVDQIVRKAEETDTDLVLIGAGKWAGREPFAPGPIADAVLDHCRRSVLAVRPGPPPVKFQRILCPVDQSPAAEEALQTAVDVARVFEGAVHVVTVVPELGRLSAVAETGRLADAQAEFKHHWRQQFEQSIDRIDFDGVSWRREIRHGVPHEEIVASAREHHADLILMGSTGRTGLARLLMGGVARRVLQDLPCSLWSVKHAEVAEELFEEDLRYIRMLLAEGREFLAAGDYRCALLKFRRVSACNPFHVESLEAQAEAYEHLGQRGRAIVCRRRAEKVRQLDAVSVALVPDR